MAEKRSKYDTDPLDPDFVRQMEDMDGATRSADARPTAGDISAPEAGTRPMPDGPHVPPPPARVAPADAPTRLMHEAQFGPSYPSVFVPPTYQPPAPYQPPTYTPPAAAPPGVVYATPERQVAGLNFAEKYAVILPYLPFWYLGVVAALIELLLVPRREVRVRFHAAQGLALQLVITALSLLFTFFGSVTGRGGGSTLFWLASFIFLLVSMVRVWKGEPHRLAPLTDATKWLNERIDPRKS